MSDEQRRIAANRTATLRAGVYFPAILRYRSLM